ncbi:MAG: hypothetical protein L0Y58_14995 [Verrucomicrobia subdivision 3 bacterium]|nr:hypothetical protein [Limisphaerales bacterium]
MSGFANDVRNRMRDFCCSVEFLLGAEPEFLVATLRPPSVFPKLVGTRSNGV